MMSKILTVHNRCTHKDDKMIVQSYLIPVLEKFITKYWTQLRLQNKVKYRGDIKQFTHLYNYILLQLDYLTDQQLLTLWNDLKQWCDKILLHQNIQCCSFYYETINEKEGIIIDRTITWYNTGRL